MERGNELRKAITVGRAGTVNLLAFQWERPKNRWTWRMWTYSTGPCNVIPERDYLTRIGPWLNGRAVSKLHQENLLVELPRELLHPSLAYKKKSAVE